mmetsp:Transcript_72101/g.206995  ORF Transcript_72101/g.206995 Transcript_72101/m.206995 type:complete len:211 (+) Transcript_72101:231-863(+)
MSARGAADTFAAADARHRPTWRTPPASAQSKPSGRWRLCRVASGLLAGSRRPSSWPEGRSGRPRRRPGPRPIGASPRHAPRGSGRRPRRGGRKRQRREGRRWRRHGRHATAAPLSSEPPPPRGRPQPSRLRAMAPIGKVVWPTARGSGTPPHACQPFRRGGPRTGPHARRGPEGRRGANHSRAPPRKRPHASSGPPACAPRTGTARPPLP